MRELLFLHRAQASLHRRLVPGALDGVLAHVADGAGEEAAGAAGRVEQDFAGLGVGHLHHEGGDGAWGVVLAGVAGRLQVVEDLLVDVAEVLALAQIVEVDAIDLVDHLAHELAGLHEVVSVFEHVAHGFRARGLGRQGLELREQFVVDELEQIVAGDAFRVGRPGAPLEFLRDGRAVVVVEQLQFLVLVVDDLEEEHPA